MHRAPFLGCSIKTKSSDCWTSFVAEAGCHLPSKHSEDTFYSFSLFFIYYQISIGTFVMFFCQWLMMVLVVRLSGYADSGILSLSISCGNVFLIIAAFGVKTYQVSDVAGKYQAGQYYAAKIFSIALTLIVAIVWGLNILGVNATAVLAGIGIVGLILGFGAQSLIEDIITGAFIIFENQYSVGDIIILDDINSKIQNIILVSGIFVLL